MTTASLALIIIVAILVQIIIIILPGLYRHKRKNNVVDTVKEIPQTFSDSLYSTPTEEITKPTPAWEGFREFIVQRREFEDVKHSICSFYLQPVDGQPLAGFRPGQFLTFKLLIEDPVSHKPKTIVRCYSLSDAPNSDYYRVTIKRVSAPDDYPGVSAGLCSNFFHDHVLKYCQVLVKAPSGHFYLQENGLLPIVLICGGIGITPMLSMLNTVLKSNINREVWLYYGISDANEHIMKEYLQTLARTHENFHLYVCYSTPRQNDVEGVDYQYNGRVSIPLLRDTLQLMRYQFYVCGPKPLMENIVPGLEELGVQSSDIYYESFGPASLIKDKQKVTDRTTKEEPLSITFSQSGKTIPWDPAADSLLEFVEANNIEVESGCRAGSCGCCQTALKSGEVVYNQIADADVTPGHCLLCISKPKNDLILEI